MTQLAFDLGRRPAYQIEDFLVTGSNAQAVAWIDRWPAWPASALAVFGPPGSGKTHLAHVFQARTGAVLLGPPDLVRGEPPALLAGAGTCVFERESGDLPEEALLHLYNHLREQGGQLLLTGTEPPARWGVALADLRSRLKAVAAVEILPPDDGLIAAVLVKLFADCQLKVNEAVITFLLAHMERSFAAARSVVAAIDAAALRRRRSITVSLVSEVIRQAGEAAYDSGGRSSL